MYDGAFMHLLPLLLLLGLPQDFSAAMEHQPQDYMLQLGFTQGDLGDLEAGKVVARVFPEKDDFEASVLGVVRINAPESAFMGRVRHLETTPLREPLLAIGRFSEPPTLKDLESLTFDTEDLDDFSKCRVGACEVQAPAEAMDLAQKVDWKAPDAKEAASRVVKEAMVSAVRTYEAQGSSGMVVYNNNPTPSSVESQIATILHNSPNLMHYNSPFVEYLLNYPKASLPSVENYVYWEKQQLHKQVVSLVHVCIEKVEAGPGEVGYFIALKHIYDTRFFFGYAEFLTMIPTHDLKGFYLVRSLRARIDPPQKLRSFLLGKIKGGMRGGLADELRATKTDLEARTGRADLAPPSRGAQRR